MPTTTDIANGALERTQVKGFTETATAEDMAKAKQMLTDLHEILLDDGTVKFELAAIPARASGPLKDELAFYMRDDFDLPQSLAVSLQARQIDARKALLRQVEIPYNGEPAEVVYY